MKIDLRYAGLTRADERRVRLASNALAAHHLVVHADSWDGQRCHVLVADGSDPQGARALVRARELAIATLDLRERDNAASEPVASVVWLTRSLHRLLRERDTSGTAPAASNADEVSGLIQLATDPTLSGKRLLARHGDLSVWLLPTTGRVVSATVSDQLNARNRLSRPGWRFQTLPTEPNWRPDAEISASLDAFYMEAAWQARAHLPKFPYGQYRLRDWPDLGSAADLVDVLRVARVLLRQQATPEDIAKASGLREPEVSACLWALRASGILSMQTIAPTHYAPAPQRRTVGLWSRLASHFGLARTV